MGMAPAHPRGSRGCTHFLVRPVEVSNSRPSLSRYVASQPHNGHSHHQIATDFFGRTLVRPLPAQAQSMDDDTGEHCCMAG